jgi:hypothetical protein|tara:strand:- start:1161 stop:1484 length:324 start_codon:yes stop_codon:yes gene_type:complete
VDIPLDDALDPEAARARAANGSADDARDDDDVVVVAAVDASIERARATRSRLGAAAHASRCRVDDREDVALAARDAFAAATRRAAWRSITRRRARRPWRRSPRARND